MVPTSQRQPQQRPFYKEPYKKRKFHHHHHHHASADATKCQPEQQQSNNQQKDRTLLNLLVSNNKPVNDEDLTGNNNSGSSKIDVLLQHLRQSPVNVDSKKDGYPWSVYEYYNHLVERFRNRPHHQPAGGKYFSSPPSLLDRCSPSSMVNDEDEANNQQRKRPTRALTGKHVKHGTGASLSTLITLRQKIQERQKAKKEIHGQRDEMKSNSRNGSATRKPKMANLKRIKPTLLPPPQTLAANLRT